MQHSVFRITFKELGAFFASPVAFIFFGVFLAATLFIFFWVETFFSRNIADVRPLFEWMPILMIFLVAALSMRMWSEERRMGTIEFLLTQPVKPLDLVLGKFLACMTLVAIALLLTIPVPLTVSLLGNVDWGPIFGGYIATLFLAAAYVSIGVTVSSKTDNQIVSLMVTVLICSIFYLLGSDTLTSLFGNKTGEIFKAVGTGSRFTSITRGVVDFRDLYYYLSIVGVFLCLNVYFLESGRWANVKRSNHTHWRWVTGLFVANFVVGNVWLYQTPWARVDMTEGSIYSISDATEGYIEQLQEPMLIRGYFSAKTHPLLAPLVPQLRDLIIEYGVTGSGKIRAEFIDPLENPELEKEAGEKFGIKPVPFQVADRYQASLVNSYFDVLIQYGDQYEVLSFRDLIEVKSQVEGEVDVELRNPEYEITRSIKKVLYKYQSSGDLFVNIEQPIKFVGYFSEDRRLPDALVKFKSEITGVLDEIKSASGGKFQFNFENPEASGSLVATEIAENYGFRPMRAGLFDPTTFYFYMILEGDGQVIQVPLPEDLEKESLRRSIDAGLKRFSSGFIKTIAMSTPAPTPPNPYMQQARMPSGKQFRLLREMLSENHKVTSIDFKTGFVPEDADLLLIVAPKTYDEKQLFAVDQFLMKGGTVILATSPFSASLNQNLSVSKHDSGLGEWMKHHGILIDETLVLDPINAKLPIPISRNLGGFTVQEIRMVEYPYFVDIRESGMHGGEITAGLPQLTMNWSSPIQIEKSKKKERKVVEFLISSEGSWTNDSTQVLPDFNTHGPLGFAAPEQRHSYPLAVIVEGRFESFFKGKESPLLASEATSDSEGEDPEKPELDEVIVGLIEKSPESARVIVFASNEFLSDETIQLAASAGGTLYTNSLQLVENAVDWSLEDRGLLSIRSRGHFSRTLYPLSAERQVFWEYMNYALGIIGLIIVYLIYRHRRRKAYQHYAEVLQQSGV